MFVLMDICVCVCACVCEGERKRDLLSTLFAIR